MLSPAIARNPRLSAPKWGFNRVRIFRRLAIDLPGRSGFTCSAIGVVGRALALSAIAAKSRLLRVRKDGWQSGWIELPREAETVVWEDLEVMQLEQWQKKGTAL